MLPPEGGEATGVARRLRVRELPLDLFGAGERVSETVAEAQLSFPYFWRKRSTRPAVSTNFCLPVKNG